VLFAVRPDHSPITMISLAQAIILGAIQGITELFPISSLGHSVLIPGLFGWSINQNAGSFLEFLVATHFATALVLLLIYRSDWIRIISGMLRSLKEREIKSSDADARLGWLLALSTVPAGFLGLILEDRIKNLFLSPVSAAFFLTLNGLLLFSAEFLRKKARKADTTRDPDKRIAAEMTWWQSLKIGLLQVIALIPGFSRTGSTIAGGLVVGLSHEDALRYSFLLATPIIGAAALLELPGLIVSGSPTTLGIAAAGCVSAAVAAYASVKFLVKYFKTKNLTPFAIYCLAFGIISLIIFAAK
jgi:undecaprenyl-diphosphatase